MGSAWAGVIGIGLNVEMPLEALPASLRARATSLRAQGGEVSMRAAEEAVLAGLGASLKLGLAAVVEQVRRRDGLRHKRVAFQSGEQVVEGVAFGIGDAGELLIAGPRSVEAYTQGTVLSVERRTLRG
jgi:biotin-(acetyl-CoA carboxylase) ligase